MLRAGLPRAVGLAFVMLVPWHAAAGKNVADGPESHDVPTPAKLDPEDFAENDPFLRPRLRAARGAIVAGGVLAGVGVVLGIVAATMRLRLAFACFSIVPDHECTGASRREILPTWVVVGIGLSLIATATIPLTIGLVRRARVIRDADLKLRITQLGVGWGGASMTLRF